MTQKGGLLATYYATIDFASPLLLESRHGHAAAVGTDVYASSDATNATTHFTRIDANVSFDVGRTSVLAGLEDSYPTQFFSVVWTGWLSPITSSLYRIHVDTYHAAYHELLIGNETRIVSKFLPTDGTLYNTLDDIEGETYVDIWLEADELVSIELRYAQKLGETKVRLLWETDRMEKVVIDEEHLYHTLGSQTTPLIFTVEPASTNGTFCHLSNDLDYRYAVVDVEETLILYLRDEFDNLQIHHDDAVRVTLVNQNDSTSADVTGTVVLVTGEPGVWQITYTLSVASEIWSMTIEVQPNGDGPYREIANSPFAIIC